MTNIIADAVLNCDRTPPKSSRKYRYSRCIKPSIDLYTLKVLNHSS